MKFKWDGPHIRLPNSVRILVKRFYIIQANIQLVAMVTYVCVRSLVHQLPGNPTYAIVIFMIFLTSLTCDEIRNYCKAATAPCTFT